MVPSDLHDFLIACIGASASFIGLLFVGLSVVLQKVDNRKKLASKDRIEAESSYASLVNIFFVCLIGILPNNSIGFTCLTLAIVGLISCFRLKKYSHIVSLSISSIVYILEVIFALSIIAHPHKYLDISDFSDIILLLFGISLVRAWGLTGIRGEDTK